ncbi:MAG: hypothetical protein HOP24_11420, partial [Sideroxydans sp.]|nr:hypothetical protein [Sideroxydans sp.]
AALTGGFGVAQVAATTCTGYAQGGARVTNAAGVGFAGAAGPMTVPVVTQIANHLAAVGGSFSGGEIVYVLAGANDIFVQLGTVGAGAITPATGVAAVGLAADELVALINTQIIAKGATRVVVLNVPDITATPFGATLAAASKGLLGSMVDTFNAQLKAGLAGNAKVLLVDVNTANKDQINNPAIYGLTNVTAMACDMTVPIQAPAAFNATSLVCNTTNVIAGDTSHYLFADGVHPTPYAHLLIARLVSKEMAVKGWI